MPHTTGKNESRTTAKKAHAAQTGKMKNSEFHQFFVDELKDIYWAEKHLLKALPTMQKAATDTKLVKAIEKHTRETEDHVERLHEVFKSLDEKAAGKKCEAMAGLLEEAKTIMEDTQKGSMVRDAGLILAAQKVEHYEIATYGTLVTFAECMGHQEVAALLRDTLENEKATDKALTKIAEGSINDQASDE